MDRVTSTLPDGDDRLRFPPVSPPQSSGTEKKESEDHRHSRPCRPSGKPFLTSSHGHRQGDALTATKSSLSPSRTICQSSANHRIDVNRHSCRLARTSTSRDISSITRLRSSLKRAWSARSRRRHRWGLPNPGTGRAAPPDRTRAPTGLQCSDGITVLSQRGRQWPGPKAQCTNIQLRVAASSRSTTGRWRSRPTLRRCS